MNLSIKWPKISKVDETMKYIVEAEKNNWFSLEEKKQLEKRLRWLSKDELDNIVARIKSNIQIVIKKDLLSLVFESEKLNTLNWYEHLREDLKESEIMRKLFKMFDAYIDEKVETTSLDVKWLSSAERDTIKLVLWEKLQSVLSPEWWIGFAIEWIIKSVWDTLGSLENFTKNNKDTKAENSLKDTYTAIQKILEGFWEDENTKKGVVQYIDSIMWNSFNNINIVRKSDKKKEIDFKNPI